MEDQRAETKERRKAEGVKVATFEFNVGDEFENAGQFLAGLLHFGLIKPVIKPKNPSDGGILMPDQPDYVVVTPFTIGWEEKDDSTEPITRVQEVGEDTEVTS